MLTTRRSTLVLCTLALALPLPALADSIRCNGKLIQVGEPKARLIAECGEPLSKEVVAVERAYAEGQPVRVSYVEIWFYPSSNTEGYQTLRFEAGRLVGAGIRCKDHLVQPGDTKVTVLKRCGEPASRDAAGSQQASPGPAARGPVSESLLEQWVYDFGPGRLLAIVTFRGGRIASIENGPRQ
jgi:hypothetical protein